MAKLGAIVPLIITFIVVGLIAGIAFVAWSIAHDVGHQTRQKLERKNVSFSRQGMKVGVKELSAEQQEDKTQSVLVKVWNNSSWPGYRSRLGWGAGDTASPSSTPSAEKRNPYSRSSSSTNTPPLSRAGSSQAAVPRTSAR